MSNVSAVDFPGPSRWGNTRNAVTTPCTLPVERTSSDILANLGSVDAIAIVRQVVRARHELGVDQSSMLAQKISMLGSEAIAHLYQDLELEETCRRVYGRQYGQLDITVQDQNTGQTSVDIITMPPIKSSTDINVSSTAMSGSRSDTDIISGQHTTPPRSQSAGSPPNVPPPPLPRKPSVRCPRFGCRSRVFYKAKRGLREHLILTHALSAIQARHDTELAFISFHDTAPKISRSRRLGLHEDIHTPTQTRLQLDQSDLRHDILAIGDQSSISAAIDPALDSTPLDTTIVNTWPQGSPLSTTQCTIWQDRNIHQSELQASITSALRRDQVAASQPVPQVAITSTPVFEYPPYLWSDNVVLSQPREPLCSLANNVNVLQQAGMQRYIPQRYDTWQYGTQQYNTHQGCVQQRGLQEQERQQDEDNDYFDESSFPSGYMRWNHET